MKYLIEDAQGVLSKKVNGSTVEVETNTLEDERVTLIIDGREVVPAIGSQPFQDTASAEAYIRSMGRIIKLIR